MTPETSTQRAKNKRLICCADGTWLASDIGTNEIPSNVAKFARALSTEGIDKHGHIIPQITQYQSGLGSAALPFQTAIAGGLGLGLDTDICQMYDFLANNYKEGDELFFFGFSRGAYTVRSVAGLICDAGILPAVQMSNFPEMWKAYRTRKNGKSFRETSWYQDNQPKLGLKDVEIEVVGVWETVGSLGIPEWPMVKLAAKYGLDINKSHEFHNVKLSPYLKHAFQALALDEKRLTFPPTLWERSAADGPLLKLQQCWFPGVHSNVGGQSEIIRSQSDFEEIGYNSLAWMIDNVSGMLTFADTAIDDLVEQHRQALHKVDDKVSIHNGWGSGPIVDNFSGLVGLFFWFLGQSTRTPGRHEATTSETMHPIVRIRKQKQGKWSPPSLQGFEAFEPDGHGTGWTWRNKQSHILPEWIMEEGKKMRVRKGKNGSTSFSWRESMSRELCPKQILRELDSENKGVLLLKSNGAHHA